MLLPTLFHRRQRQIRRAPRRSSRTRLLLEWLEPRNLLSVMNINTDTDLTAPHAETSIAVNPTNPLNLIGNVADYQAVYGSSGQFLSVTEYSRAHVTFDGGQTWSDNVVPFNTSLYNFTGDPGVAFDADGTAYISTLGTLSTPGHSNPSDIQVSHSTDSGQTWSVPVRVAAGSGTPAGKELNNDKPYIAAWGHGNAIVTWTEFNTNGDGTIVSSPIFASVTHDGGNIWTLPVQISGNFIIDQASVPVVAADGSIYVAFLSGESFGDNFHDNYMVVKVDPTTAKVLKDPVKVADLVDANEDYPRNVDKRDTYQDSEFRTWSAGNIAADPTNALHLAVVWSDMRNSTLPPPTDPYQAKTNSDIVMSQSYDGGNTWSSPTALAIPNDQFMPWGAYNGSGQLQIGFFDRSYDPANHKYGYTLASETVPGSLKFTEQQVTTALSDPTQGDAFFAVKVNSNFPNATRFMGDYGNIAISPNGVAAFWTDMRLQSTAPAPHTGSNEDAFFALVDPPPPPATASAAAVKQASAALPSGTALTGAIPRDVGISKLPSSTSANALPNENVVANAPAPTAGIWQWLISQQTVDSSTTLTDGPNIAGSTAANAEADGSVWNDPFVALVLGF